MNITKKLAVLGTVTTLALAATACQDKPAEPKAEDPAAKNGATTTTANAAATAAPAPAATQVTVSDSDVATPADFEEAAERSITPKNYKAELGTLEKELEKDGT